MVIEKSHAPEAAKIHSELSLLVKYCESAGESTT